MTKKGKNCQSLSRGFQVHIMYRRLYTLCTVSENAQKMVIWGDSTPGVPSEAILTVHKTYSIYISTIHSRHFNIYPYLYLRAMNFLS